MALAGLRFGGGGGISGGRGITVDPNDPMNRKPLINRRPSDVDPNLERVRELISYEKAQGNTPHLTEEEYDRISGLPGTSGNYLSPNMGQIDEAGIQAIFKLLGESSGVMTPLMRSKIIAAQLGGSFNAQDGTITLPNGSKMQLDPSRGIFVSNDPEAQQYISQANMMNQQVSQTGGEQEYNPHTGRFEARRPDKPGNINPRTGQFEPATPLSSMMGSEAYLSKFGDYLNKGYTPESYTPQGFKDYNYQAPNVQSVSNISDAARANIYQRGADRIATTFRDKSQDLEDWSGRQGSTLSSGRLQREQQKLDTSKLRELSQFGKDADTDHEMRTFEDAKRVRDIKAQQDMDIERLRGDQNLLGQKFDTEDRRYGAEFGRGEKRYALEDLKKTGESKMNLATGLDAAQYDRAVSERQAAENKQSTALSALLDMFRAYSGQAASASDYAAKKAAAKSQVLGSAIGAAGQIGSSVFGPK